MIHSESNRNISLIFVNYRSAFSLSLALRSLCNGNSGVEVIVVNQDANEQSILETLASQYGFHLVQRENRGFAAGANTGARAATRKYLVFLNPDTMYRSGSLSLGVAALESDLSLGALGPVLCDMEGMVEPWSRGPFISLPRLLMQNLLPEKWATRHSKVDWISGGALLMRRDIFDSLGGFDERFFLYFEDMDLCYRAKARGLRSASLPELQFSHRGGQSFSSKSLQKKHYFQSQKHYFEKHRSFVEQKILNALLALKNVLA